MEFAICTDYYSSHLTQMESSSYRLCSLPTLSVLLPACMTPACSGTSHNTQRLPSLASASLSAMSLAFPCALLAARHKPNSKPSGRRRNAVVISSALALAMLPPDMLSPWRTRRNTEMVDGTERNFAKHPLARLLRMIPRLALPNFELPRMTLPRALARLRMQLALRSAAGRKISADTPFRLNGLGWHHMAIESHLRALQLCAVESDSDAVAMEGAFAFVLAKVWRTYNTLERDVLFPWVAAGAGGDARVTRALSGLSTERDRIERAAVHVEKSMRALAGSVDQPTSRRSRRRTVAAVKSQRAPGGSAEDFASVARALADLLEDAERLHRAERDILFPIIATHFSESDQRAFTARMVRTMDINVARLQLVNYYETIKHSKEQLRKFQEEVPVGVRMFLPVWKSRWYDKTPLADLHSRK